MTALFWTANHLEQSEFARLPSGVFNRVRCGQRAGKSYSRTYAGAALTVSQTSTARPAVS